MANRISIIIPTKNEPYVKILVDELNKKIKNKEIIVIEKGKILPKVKAKVVRQKTNGLGNAFLEAAKYAHGNIIANMDGDGSHRVEDLKKMIAEIKNADLVIGSKLVKGGRNEDLWYRQLITQYASKIYSFILGLEIHDMTSGFFVIRKEVLDRARIKKVFGFKIIFPIVFYAKKYNFKTKEVPIVFEKRKSGVSTVSIFKISGIKEVSNELKMAILLRLGLF